MTDRHPPFPAGPDAPAGPTPLPEPSAPPAPSGPLNVFGPPEPAAPGRPPVGAVVLGLTFQALRRGLLPGGSTVRSRADAARAIGVSPRAVTRLEGALGAHGIGADGRRALLALYGVNDPDAREATARLPFARDPETLDDRAAGWSQRLAACVSRSGRVRTYSLTAFPRMLWTAGYAHALCSTYLLPTELFTPPARVPDGVHTTAIVDEMVLYHLWNIHVDPGVIAAQLDHVLALVAAGALTVRIVGMQAQPAHPCALTELADAGGRHHLFAEELPDFEGVRYHAGPDTSRCLLDGAEDRAMTPAASLATLRTARDHYPAPVPAS